MADSTDTAIREKERMGIGLAATAQIEYLTELLAREAIRLRDDDQFLDAVSTLSCRIFAPNSVAMSITGDDVERKNHEMAEIVWGRLGNTHAAALEKLDQERRS